MEALSRLNIHGSVACRGTQTCAAAAAAGFFSSASHYSNALLLELPSLMHSCCTQLRPTDGIGPEHVKGHISQHLAAPGRTA